MPMFQMVSEPTKGPTVCKASASTRCHQKVGCRSWQKAQSERAAAMCSKRQTASASNYFNSYIICTVITSCHGTLRVWIGNVALCLHLQASEGVPWSTVLSVFFGLRLNFTVSNLRRSFEWSNEPWPIPQRLPRRSWRVSYLKRPFRSKITIRCALRQEKKKQQCALLCPEAITCFTTFATNSPCAT